METMNCPECGIKQDGILRKCQHYVGRAMVRADNADEIQDLFSRSNFNFKYDNHSDYIWFWKISVVQLKKSPTYTEYQVNWKE